MSGYVNPKGTVQRLEGFKMLHLTRSEALFAETEWDWSEERSEAYVFPSYEEAEARALELRGEGVGHVHAFVCGSDWEMERSIGRKEPLPARESRESGGGYDPVAVHQRNLERMHLD